jgi:hypothetical protein
VRLLRLTRLQGQVGYPELPITLEYAYVAVMPEP